VIPNCGHDDCWFLITQYSKALEGPSEVCCWTCTQERVQELKEHDGVMITRVGG
jgi:hypothetical protein